MSINNLELTNDRIPLLVAEEQLVLQQNSARLQLESSDGYPGSPRNYVVAAGTLYLTTMRLIYISTTPQAMLDSFSVPLLNCTEVRTVSPWFSSKRFESTILPIPNASLSQPLTLRIQFDQGDVFDLMSSLRHLQEKLMQQPAEEALPVYSSSSDVPSL